MMMLIESNEILSSFSSSQRLVASLLHNLLDDNDNGQLSPNPTTDFLFQQIG